MKLVLAPVYSAWNKTRLKDFYLNDVVNMDVDTVYVGEVICQKRSSMTEEDHKEIISALHDTGKKVIYSTLALITSNEELEKTLKYHHLFDGVEVNSFGVLNTLIKNEEMLNNKITIGPFMNIYNSVATDFMSKFNPLRLVTPYEVPCDTIKEISDNSNIPLEVNAWGHLSTALSWRCYTARTYETTREACFKKCFEFPDGIQLDTLKKEDLYIINGIQILSTKIHCLIEQIDLLRDLNVSFLRITPGYDSTSEVVEIFNKALNNEVDIQQAVSRLSELSPHGLGNGWMFGKPGWDYVKAA